MTLPQAAAVCSEYLGYDMNLGLIEHLRM